MITQEALKCINGIQHIGIPTNNIEETIRFYSSLGFELVYRTFNEASREKVAFLRLHNITIETYENNNACMCDGAINHIALDVDNIELLFDSIKKEKYNIITDTIQYLPFWEKGVRYFIIKGPNNENIEFCEILKA